MIGPKITGKKGLVMITAYMIIVAMSILAIASVRISAVEYNFANRYFLSQKAYYLAEAGTDITAYLMAGYVANYEDEPAGPTDEWTELGTTTTDFLSTGFNLDNECVSMDLDQTVTDAQGIVSVVRHYQILGTATDPDTGIESIVNTIVSRAKTYTFQHAIFYAHDLELLPGQDMTMAGKIHANENIYIGGVGDTTDLIIDAEYLYSAGDIYNMRKDDPSATLSGDVSIKVYGTSDFASMVEAGDEQPLDSSRSDWGTASQERWGGTVKSSEHGVKALAVPEVGSIAPDGYYASNADVKVLNGEIYKGGSLLVEGVDIPSGTVSTSTSFYDNREGIYVKITDIDLKKLAGYEQQFDEFGDPILDGDGDPVYSQTYSNNLPDNQLLYATRDDAGESEMPGIRLVNGAEIYDSQGLTVVTNDPVYVQGDFNLADEDDPGKGYTKKPVSVVSDALNVLSNNWLDANSISTLGDRTAAGTQVNAAFIAGIVPTAEDIYSGGLENYPRLHESWSGQTLTVSGAFISLWDSSIATGQWAYGSPVYTAPVRDWGFDSDFFNSNNLPAYTPYAVSLEKVAFWEGEEEPA